MTIELISEPCDAGKYLDQDTGCQDCPADKWSTGGKPSSCTACPTGKRVDPGVGKSENDCIWSKKISRFILSLLNLIPAGNLSFFSD